ncbi:A disintegrin and metalloproteinase with thrombospondin motifs 7-like [Linepithema humile]|uniref:A disintegrin and metalloproteinase with thrombospondin motifs 7-like n=1 Tax=Linepithema humile TaxID=83485 RepID=UPI0006232206|nr:PREDICTED: A disintegrin and metalloproteinase with thrombospondin motifs 7-like [Linepithema humile]
MFFILKLVLIILLNETYAYITQNTETTLLPAWYPTDAKKIPLSLKVFGQLIQLNLHRNDRIVSPEYEVLKYHIKDKLSQLKASDPCLYIHKDHVSSAIINFCNEHGLEGLVFLKNDNFEIRPLRNDLASLSLLDDICVQEQINFSFGKPHLIKRLQYFANSNLYHFDNFKPKRRYVRNTQPKLILELAVFLDESATDKNNNFLYYNDEKLRDLIFAYVNQIQMLFRHPSFGDPIDIWLVHLEIMKEQPKDLPVYDFNEREVFSGAEILNSFCRYSTNSLFKKHHWDLALYLTGLNFHKHRHGNEMVSGLTFPGVNLCNHWHFCAVAKFGAMPRTTNSGFALSARIAAHEIGHIFGMEHDEDPNGGKCDKDKYVMGFNPIRRGQITWSNCSRNIIEKKDVDKWCLEQQNRSKYLDDAYAFYHLHYHDLPGREWTAKAQCELYFRDHDANVVTLHDICDTLECETPDPHLTSHDKTSHIRIGPALEGTYCALGKECRGGKCVPVQEPPYIFNYYRKDKWSKWKVGPCESSCIEKSKGVRIRRRFCEHRNIRTANCKGPYYDVVMCNEFSCNDFKRKTISQFAQLICNAFRSALQKHNHPIQLENNIGSLWRQRFHNVEKPWIACTIFCLLKNTSIYYPIREIMFEFDQYPYISFPYFPDGT